MNSRSSDHRPMRVGIVGLSPDEGWAQRAHLPALRSLSTYDVRGVANSSLASATTAATAFGIDAPFAAATDLAQDPGIDLVVVTVKVPRHFDLVIPALAAGKMVYCEWPLGNGLAEAKTMASAAAASGARTLAGMQARSSPVVRYVHDLVRDGYVGEVLSTTLVGSGGNWGAEVAARDAYTHDRANGADLLTIPLGHALDALCHCLGSFEQVTATSAMRRSTYAIRETGEQRPMHADDQIVVEGVLQGGAVVAAHYRGGASRGTNLRWEINGTRGDLEVTAGSGHLQIAPLQLRGGRDDDRDLATLDVPSSYRLGSAELTGGAVNVGEAYIQFAIGEAARFPVPDFQAALETHKLIDAIQRSSASGTRIEL